MRLRRTIVLIMALLILVTGQSTPARAAAATEVEIEASLLEFDPVSKVYKATGGVKFTSGDFRLQAETLVYNQEADFLTAEQGVKLQTAAGEWEGERLEYSFRGEQGTLTTFSGKNGDIFISGTKGELSGEEILVQGGSFAKCELPTPCLKIKAGQVRLVNDKVQVKRGWLYVKNLPVLPLPPLTFAIDQFENWPQLEVGASGTRGYYVLGKMTHEVNDQVRLDYGGGVGSKKWWNVQTGMNWDLTSDLVLNSTLTWEEYLRGKASLTYQWAPVQFRAAVSRDWDELTSGDRTLLVQGPLTEKSNLELNYTSSFNEKTNGMHRREDYGLQVNGSWIPGFTLGGGLYFGQGDLKTNYLNGWYLRTTWSGGIKLAPTWRMQVSGEARWQEGIDPLWVSSQVKLGKDLHCFNLGLGYDLLDESISFNLGFNW